ncbi:PA14 domain-containing protein, partial [Flavobacterium salmonis]|uniref:PA14 domain-containing protein n=2 Tax=Flavobacterium salmonis TaxID=2654844 RepID=UPI003620B6ED
MKKTLLKSRVLATVLFFTVFLFGNTVFGQTTGDYRSVGTGNWTTLSSWQYYNGTSWVAATSYPGQSAGTTKTVTIRDTHSITLNTNITNSFTSLVIGNGSSGKLIVNGTITVNTKRVTINSNGLMSFVGSSTITFPANTSFVVNGGRLVSESNPCSNNTALYIGSTKVSACNGNGGGALSDFDTFNARGGTGSVTSNSPVCNGNTLTFTATPPTATSGSYTYEYKWSGNGISTGYSSSPTYSTTANYYNHGGTYTVDIRRNDGIVSTVSTDVVVNPTPVGGGVYDGNSPICLNSSTGNMTLRGGYVGNIVRWEKKLSTDSSWTPISNTSAVYSENPSVAGTWQYRAVVGSGACPVVYSSPFSVVVNPELTITLVSNNSIGCQNNSNSTLSYTSITGNANLVYLDFTSSAVFGSNMHQVIGVSAGPGTITIQYNWGAAPGTYNGVLTVVKDTQTPNCTSSITYPISLTINPAGTVPPSISSQPVAPPAVCSGSGTQTISVAATGTGLTYQWRRNSSPLTNGGVISGATTSTLTLTNPTTANAGTYDVVVTGTCSSGVTSNQVTVTVNANLSAVAVTPNIAQNVCITGSGSALTASPTGGGTVTYQWGKRSVSGGAITAIGGQTSASYTPTGAGLTLGTWYIVCTGTPTCGSPIISNEVTVTVNQALSAAPITPNTAQNICVSAPGTALTVTPTGGGTVTYQWGKRSVSGGAITAIGGQTASSYTPTGASLTAGTWLVVCTSTPSCGSPIISNEVTVTVNTAPVTPGTITQPTNICAGTTGNIYSIASVNGATSYNWSVTGAGWAVTAGGTTASATITIGSGAGTVSVTATNACGTSSASTTGSVTPTTAPSTPGTITQPTNKCAGSTGNTYSIAAVSAATSYTWSVTGTGWSVTAGGNTTSATITIGSGVGTVSVTATNGCGTSSASTTGSITPTTAPTTPGTITQPVNKYTNTTGNIFAIAAVSGATSYTWSVTGTGWSITSGGNTTSATITIGSGVGTVSVTASNACGTSSASITGNVTPDTVCTATTETPGNNYWKGYVYTYNGTPTATTYIGSVAEKPVFDRNVATGTITGDSSVEANNFCGPAPSDNFFVRYLMNVTLAEAGNYVITVGGDDGYRLYIDNVLVTSLSNWGDHSYTYNFTTQTLTAGSHIFKLEYYENGGDSRVSFSYGLPKGDPNLPFGDKVWNVYGFIKANLDFTNTELRDSYAGYYIDPNINIQSQTFWNKTQSPSVNNSAWNGAPIQVDYFTMTYKRKGFPCGRYQIQLVNCDDVAQIYIDGSLIFTQAYTTTGTIINSGAYYTLNKNSEVEIRLREDAGDANVAFNFIDVPFAYDGSTAPPSGTSIAVSQDSILANSAEVCSCYISSGKTLTVPADVTLSVIETIDVKTDGKLVIKNNGSLLQDTNGLYIGAANSFIMERTSFPMKNFDATYWSSPVVGQTLVGLSPNTLSDKYIAYYDSA